MSQNIQLHEVCLNRALELISFNILSLANVIEGSRENGMMALNCPTDLLVSKVFSLFVLFISPVLKLSLIRGLLIPHPVLHTRPTQEYTRLDESGILRRQSLSDNNNNNHSYPRLRGKQSHEETLPYQQNLSDTIDYQYHYNQQPQQRNWNDSRYLLASQLQYHLFAMDILSQIIGLAFNIRNQISPTAYAELWFLLVQNIAILSMAMWWLDKTRMIPVILLLITVTFNILLNPVFISRPALTNILVLGSTPLTILSLVPALLANYRRKSCAGFPLSMLLIGQAMGGARVLTTYIEVSQLWGIIGSALVGPALNLLFIVQYIVYRGGATKSD